MRIHLLRHGQTSWNKQSLVQGQTDIPLDEEGQRQADTLVPYFASVQLAAVYASALQRAQETAYRATNGTYPIITVPNFNERNFGIFEGTPIADITQELRTQLRNHTYCPEKGESHETVEKRVQMGIEEILKSHEAADEIAIFGHKETNFRILSYLIGIEQARAYRAGNNCSGVVLQHAEQWSVERMIL